MKKPRVAEKDFSLPSSLGPEAQEYLRRKRQRDEDAASWAARNVTWEEELKEAKRQRVRRLPRVLIKYFCICHCSGTGVDNASA